MIMVIEITIEDIKEGILDTPNIMQVVMCYGATCGPCSFTMPHYEETERHFKTLTTNINFYKINAWEPEEQKKFCEQYWAVSGVPTFKVFYNSQEAFTRTGGGDFSVISLMVNDAITEVYKKFGVKI